MIEMAAGWAALLFITTANAASVPEDFPRFVVPGQEKELESLRTLFWRHYEPGGPLIPLWDEWMPMSTLWPATGPEAPPESMAGRWARALADRIFDGEGYVHTQQHDGPAHAEGWPFPRWMEAGGIGWHFRGTGISGYDAPPATPEGWTGIGGRGGEVNDKGWIVDLTEPGATLQPPSFKMEAKNAPWLRLNWWASGLEGACCYVEWTTEEQPQFNQQSRAYFAAATSAGHQQTLPPMGPKSANELFTATVETRTMIPVYRIPEWKGVITGLRINFNNRAEASVVIKSFHTACDTRHNINNGNFIRGCHDYFMWTGDVTFLREEIGRVRSAMRYIMNEFNTRERKCIYTTWPGHEGRSGVRRTADGQKVIVPGEGIGSNYWDILPFGGEDALATIYYYDTLLDLADLEEQIVKYPQWCIATGAEAFDPADLRKHAQEVKDYGTKRFWNNETGRFGTVDLDGVLHDYGFTFLNNEAVYYDFATPEQAKTIRDWISGRRVVESDTSTGADIYHWRFGPRSTTKRNLDYYIWGYSNPENIPWGFQVQDGGAVLGFSYHDLMARLMTDGPDDAWQRLKEILAWFDETQAAGGYRAYYKDPKNGTMQGGNVSGGLGIDTEFFESILVPQVMLYGFLGFRPTADGFTVNPRLPTDWPELTITRIRLHGNVFDITARDKTIIIKGKEKASEPLIAELPAGWQLSSSPADLVTNR
ncbi:MAG TPA: hypothetical protein PLI09_29060 [Candidatus Hydrogenedentes bacterium]|nr:hypothetical protein [Candidatus Hydrogenedentota bacterium]